MCLMKCEGDVLHCVKHTVVTPDTDWFQGSWLGLVQTDGRRSGYGRLQQTYNLWWEAAAVVQKWAEKKVLLSENVQIKVILDI